MKISGSLALGITGLVLANLRRRSSGRKEIDMTSRQQISLAVVLMVALCMPVSSVAGADQDDRDGGRLGAEWWQHLISIPTQLNPILDETGASCMIGQRGDIWFLHGSLGNALGSPIERSCTIPTGKRIFLPVINLICIPFPDETIQQNARACKEAIDAVNFTSLEIDGRARDRLIERAQDKKGFDVTAPDDNLFGAPAGVYIAVHDGFFALLPVLRPGEHTIHFKGSSSGPSGFSVDVIYHIHVVEPGPIPLP